MRQRVDSLGATQGLFYSQDQHLHVNPLHDLSHLPLLLPYSFYIVSKVFVTDQSRLQIIEAIHAKLVGHR